MSKVSVNHYETTAEDSQANAQGKNTAAIQETSEKPRKRSFLSKFVRGTVRAALVASAFDVIKTDSKRIRVRHPKVWRELFSAEGAKRLKTAILTEKTKRISSFPKDALLSAMMSIGLLTGVIALIAKNPFPPNMGVVNHIGLAVIFVVLVICSVIYSAITIIQISRHRRRQSGSQSK